MRDRKWESEGEKKKRKNGKKKKRKKKHTHAVSMDVEKTYEKSVGKKLEEKEKM
jgi:hypothetical protein